jgi:modulator of FtsH protease HflC
VNNLIKLGLIGLVIALIVVVANGLYVVPEGKQAVITQFGRPVGESVSDAGLHYKLPFVQKATYYEKKILVWDGQPNQIPTNDKTFVHLDVTARWRISDPLVFLQTVNNVARANNILDGIIDGSVRDTINQNDLIEVIRSSDWSSENMAEAVAGDHYEIRLGRDKIAGIIYQNASRRTPQYGIELVDVMFKRVDYIDSVRERVYDRMISERKRVAAERRSQGEGLKAEIMGKVDRELKEILSASERQSQEIRGRADAKAANIYSAAYNQDPEFYSFYETLAAYRKTIGSNTRLIISANSPFYRYLDQIN